MILFWLGSEVIGAVEEIEHDWRQAQPYVQSSNRLKRLVTKAVGGIALLEYHLQKLALIAGEVVLAMAALRARLHNEEAGEHSLATGMEGLFLFKPALRLIQE